MHYKTLCYVYNMLIIAQSNTKDLPTVRKAPSFIENNVINSHRNQSRIYLFGTLPAEYGIYFQSSFSEIMKLIKIMK